MTAASDLATQGDAPHRPRKAHWAEPAVSELSQGPCQLCPWPRGDCGRGPGLPSRLCPHTLLLSRSHQPHWPAGPSSCARTRSVLLPSHMCFSLPERHSCSLCVPVSYVIANLVGLKHDVLVSRCPPGCGGWWWGPESGPGFAGFSCSCHLRSVRTSPVAPLHPTQLWLCPLSRVSMSRRRSLPNLRAAGGPGRL